MISESRVGEVLAAKYRLEALLGSGAMGDVYRATNQLFGRTVAIKVLRSEHATNAPIVERFLREARAANLVRHPNVVDVLDIGQDDRGTPFIVQELLDGEDLARYVERHGAKLKVAEVIELLCPVIDAVAEAHARGVVHRDIKPENVFLARMPGGRTTPKLLDFGISQVRAPDIRTTQVGLTMGTPGYMAPEQVRGARDVDARSDVWALGVTLFELLSGRMPFDAPDAPALFVAVATQDAPRLADVARDVPLEVARIVDKCLRRMPDDRYSSAAELARELRAAVAPKTLVHNTGAPERVSAVARTMVETDVGAPDLPALPSLIPVPVRAPAPKAKAAASIPAELSLDVAVPKQAPPVSRARAEGPLRPAPVGMADEPAPAVPDAARPSPNARRPEPKAGPMTGVMLGPAPSRRTRPPIARDTFERKEDDTEVALVLGVVVVGLVALLPLGTLMHLFHRGGGWPVVTMAVKDVDATVRSAIQMGLGVTAVLLAARQIRHGVRAWQGTAPGGGAGAIIAGLVAAGALFGAVELVAAAF